MCAHAAYKNTGRKTEPRQYFQPRGGHEERVDSRQQAEDVSGGQGSQGKEIWMGENWGSNKMLIGSAASSCRISYPQIDQTRRGVCLTYREPHSLSQTTCHNWAIYKRTYTKSIACKVEVTI